jgi:MFS superfamily sulfate permease-like transporter
MARSSSRFSGFDLRADIIAGFLVFLIALPLSLGISIASGFPPIAGVMTAMIGGILASLIGSARLTIKGPAAGLIVIVVGAVTELGAGDMSVGYKRAIAVGVVAGVIQVVMALARLGFLGTLMPPPVVRGMLSAIGVIIIAKQIHVVTGYVPTSKNPLALLGEIPNSLMHLNPEVFAIGALGLAVLFLLPRLNIGLLEKVPGQLIVVLLTVPLAMIFGFAHQHSYQLAGGTFEVGPKLLVQLPANLLSAITMPDFSVIMSGTSIKYIVMFTLVGSIESLLSVSAVDAMDPAKRASDMDKDLFALGVCNTLAAAIGGLPMISEIVRSKANIDSGATSPFANLSHGTFLLLFVALLPGVLQAIPLAALAAMLVYTGTRLASPREFSHAWHIGREQFFIFMTTLLITLGVDLLAGVFAGLILNIVIHVVQGAPIASLFRSRIDQERDGDVLTLVVHGAAVFSNMRGITKPLQCIDDSVHKVIIDFNDCAFVDHTTQNRLSLIAGEWSQCVLELRGLESFRASSDHVHAARIRRAA